MSNVLEACNTDEKDMPGRTCQIRTDSMMRSKTNLLRKKEYGGFMTVYDYDVNVTLEVRQRQNK